MTTYIGLALADSMFEGECIITRHVLEPEQVKVLLPSAVSCANPSHQATLVALKQRYGIDLPVPATPPRVVARPGDTVVVIGVRGLPRLTDRHEYTDAEIARAEFSFALYRVEPVA